MQALALEVEHRTSPDQRGVGQVVARLPQALVLLVRLAHAAVAVRHA